MSAYQISFYVISAAILISAFLAVTSLKIFRSAVWLLGSLTAIAALYFWMDLQFLAAVQIIVYIGGIVVLIIFSIFLTAHMGADLPRTFLIRKIFSALLAIGGFSMIAWVLTQSLFTISDQPLDSGVAMIGRSMLATGDKGYALPFEAVSILLLVAMIGCIAIAIRPKENKA
jgi:NADH-quinone oxidoreductase subunit J